MIHQMMLLMHLEMQLRQQALVSYQEAQDPAQRMQRLDDVMALNEQLNEVGSILGVLLNTPLDRGPSTRHAAATSTTLSPSPRAGRHNLTGRFAASVPGAPTSLPTFRFHALDTDTDDDDDDDVSNVAADYDDDDVSEDDSGQAGGDSSASSVRNSYNFDSLMTSSSHQPAARVTVNLTAAGASASTSGNSGVSRASMLNGSGTDHHQLTSTMPPASTSIASNGYSSVLLSRRRQRPATPRWTAGEPTVTSVTVNDLRSPAADPSQAAVRTTPAQTVALPQIQSGGVVAASQMNLDHAQPAVVGRQLTVSDASAGTPRQPQPVSGNRSLVVSSAAVVTNSQTLPAMSHVVPSGATGVSASQALDINQASANRSSVLTEPWPVLSTAEPRTSTLVSTTNRSSVAQPAGRLSRGRGDRGLARSTNTDSHHLESDRRPAGAVAHGPRRPVQDLPNSRPALQLRRSLVRNSLGRPAGPASVSTLRQTTTPHRMVPLPHPAVRATHQQVSLDRSAAVGRNYASNDDVLRPRRRSEIAHEIMFPPHEDTEQ